MEEKEPPAPAGDGGQEAAGAQAGPPRRRSRRKGWMAAGIAAAVVVAAGAGFWAWHSQPSFCNAICHSPMDNYVAGYYDDGTLLAHAHQEADVTCLGCHVPTLGQQISEGMAWLQGDFAVDAQGNVAQASDETLGTREFCLRCHDDGDAADGKDWDEIVSDTADWGGYGGANPHKSHNGDQECSECHSAHGTSVMACNECHGFEVPDGWDQPKSF